MQKPSSAGTESRYIKIDPFPFIAPALLNSADIESYVNATGMVSPFYKEDLKSSSYAVKMKGKCRWWDETGEVKEMILDGKNNKRFKLLPNSIAFIELEPIFRLPDYIAVRFNLRIKNVYRGLLLGTGPLIDPGFEGKIYIPLHNLTANEYIFEYGEELVWFEFTKTSAIPGRKSLEKDEDIERGTYQSFPDDKKNKDLLDYLDSASNGEPIISSIPDALRKSQSMAEKANKSVGLIRNLGFIALAAILVSAASLVITSWRMQQSYIDKVQNLEILIKDEYVKTVEKNDASKDKILKRVIDESLRIETIENQNRTMKNEIGQLKKCISSLTEKTNNEEIGDFCES